LSPGWFEELPLQPGPIKPFGMDFYVFRFVSGNDMVQGTDEESRLELHGLSGSNLD
jgi:hypothetical protein